MGYIIEVGNDMQWTPGPAAPAAGLELSRDELLNRSDDVLQQLTLAKYALELGDQQRALDAVEAALTRSRAIITALLRDTGRVTPGADH